MSAPAVKRSGPRPTVWTVHIKNVQNKVVFSFSNDQNWIRDHRSSHTKNVRNKHIHLVCMTWLSEWPYRPGQDIKRLIVCCYCFLCCFLHYPGHDLKRPRTVRIVFFAAFVLGMTLKGLELSGVIIPRFELA
jgi:hypothetical protein